MIKRTKLEQTIASRQYIIDKMIGRNKKDKKQLQAVIDKKKEPEVPKLKHGDYGTLSGSPYFVNFHHPTQKKPFGISDSGGQMGFDKFADEFIKSGNVFDEISAKQAKVGEKSEQGKSEVKPELRHGDYGTDYEHGYHRIAIKDKYSDKVDVWNDCGVKNPEGRIPRTDKWLGNIFDDLTETCEGFEMENGGGYTSLTAITGDSMDSGVRIRHGNASVVIGGSVLDEFIANLQKVANHIRSKK